MERLYIFMYMLELIPIIISPPCSPPLVRGKLYMETIKAELDRVYSSRIVKISSIAIKILIFICLIGNICLDLGDYAKTKKEFCCN
jgi:hypothetical protein